MRKRRTAQQVGVLLWAVFAGALLVTVGIDQSDPPKPKHAPYPYRTVTGIEAERAAEARLADQWQTCADLKDWTSEFCVKFDQRGIDYGVVTYR